MQLTACTSFSIATSTEDMPLRPEHYAARAVATYASCGKVNLPPSSMSGVDKAVVLDATDAIIARRSGSLRSFSRTVIGVARS